MQLSMKYKANAARCGFDQSHCPSEEVAGSDVQQLVRHRITGLGGTSVPLQEARYSSFKTKLHRISFIVCHMLCYMMRKQLN